MKNLAILVALFLGAVSANAAIYRVSPDGTGTHTTISAAIAATSANDTIVIRGDLGVYTEELSLPRPLTLIGQGTGCEYDTSTNTWTNNVAATQLNGSISLNASVCSGTVIEGLRVSAGSRILTISTGNSGIMIRRCCLTMSSVTGNGYTAISVEGTSTVSFENCLVIWSAGSWGYGIRVESTAAVTLTNSVVSVPFNGGGNSYDVYLAAIGASAMISNCALIGGAYATGGSGNWAVDHTVLYGVNAASTISGNITVSYNAYPSTLTAWPAVTGDVILSATPFINYTSGIYQICTAGSPTDLHPAVASPLIDAGDPTLPGDIEGEGTATRDIGIYGGEDPMVDTGAPDFPFVTNLLVDPSVPQNGVLEVRATGRVGRGQ